MTVSAVVRSGFLPADDGTRLYWRTIGPAGAPEGTREDGRTGIPGPVIACCNGVGVSVFFWKYLVEHFSSRFTVLLWDYRAHGRSDRVGNGHTGGAGDDLTVSRHARDLGAVLDGLGIEKALLVGHSMGCQVIFEAFRLFPERVAGLVPMLGTAGRTLEDRKSVV